MKAATIILSRTLETTDEQFATLMSETHEAIITSFIGLATEQFIIGANPDGMIWIVFDISDFFDFSILDDKLFSLGEILGTGAWTIIDGEGYYA